MINNVGGSGQGEVEERMKGGEGGRGSLAWGVRMRGFLCGCRCEVGCCSGASSEARLFSNAADPPEQGTHRVLVLRLLWASGRLIV